MMARWPPPPPAHGATEPPPVTRPRRRRCVPPGAGAAAPARRMRRLCEPQGERHGGASPRVPEGHATPPRGRRPAPPRATAGLAQCRWAAGRGTRRPRRRPVRGCRLPQRAVGEVGRLPRGPPWTRVAVIGRRGDRPLCYYFMCFRFFALGCCMTSLPGTTRRTLAACRRVGQSVARRMCRRVQRVRSQRRARRGVGEEPRPPFFQTGGGARAGWAAQQRRRRISTMATRPRRWACPTCCQRPGRGTGRSEKTAGGVPTGHGSRIDDRTATDNGSRHWSRCLVRHHHRPLIVLHRRSSGGLFVAHRHHACSPTALRGRRTVNVLVIRAGRPDGCRTRVGCGDSGSTARTPRVSRGMRALGRGSLVKVSSWRDVNGTGVSFCLLPLPFLWCMGGFHASPLTPCRVLVVAPGLCPCPPFLGVTAVCWRDGVVWRRRRRRRGQSWRRRPCGLIASGGPCGAWGRSWPVALSAMIAASHRCIAACGGDWAQKQCTATTDWTVCTQPRAPMSSRFRRAGMIRDHQSSLGARASALSTHQQPPRATT